MIRSGSCINFRPPLQERRRSPRFPKNIPAAVRTTDGRSIQANIANVSAGGFLLSADNPVAPGQLVQIDFCIGGASAVCSGRVLRCTPASERGHAIAVQCATPLAVGAQSDDSGLTQSSGSVHLPYSFGLAQRSVTFRGVVYAPGTCSPPIAEVPHLSDDIDVVLFPACIEVGGTSGEYFANNLFRYIRTWPRYLIDLRGSYETYSQKFSPKSRSTLKRKARRLAEFAGGAVEYIECRSAEQLSEFFQSVRKVALGSYQKQVLRSELPEEWFWSRAMPAAERDEARGYLLLVRGKPVAYLFCLASHDTLVHYYSGYDTQLAKFSPGVLIQQFALQRLFAEQRFSTFDFMSGGGQHKEFFSTTHLWCADVYFFRTTLKTLFLAGAHAACSGLSLGVGSLVRWGGLKARLKHLLTHFAD